MNKKMLIIGALALFALSRNTGASIIPQKPTITPTQASQIGQATLAMNTYLNGLANNVAYGGNDYNFLLDLQKQAAGIGIKTLENSGFMTYSDGFKDLAKRLGIL